MEEHVQRYTTLETVLDVQGLEVCVTRIANFEELLEALDPITFAEDERLPSWRSKVAGCRCHGALHD